MSAVVLGPPGAPEIVCVPGLGCSHRYFLPLARQLAPRYRVAAVDLFGRGHAGGLGIRDLSLALAGWLRSTGGPGRVLVANSAGCQVVVDLAVHSPELLGPVVLVSPTVDPRARSAPRQAWRLARAAVLEPLSLWWIVAGDYLRNGPHRLLTALRHAIADPVETKLSALAVPTVVVRGGRDPLVPREWAQQVAASLPAGRYAEVPGAGHALNYSAAVELARVVEELAGG